MSSPRSPAGQQTVRRHNLRLLLTEITRAVGSRADLSLRTGLTKATISGMVDSLIAQGLLREGEPSVAGVGRPSRPLGFNPDGPIALGVEINVDYTAACVIDMTGTVRCYEYRPLDNRGMSSFEVLGHACSLVRAVRSGFEQPLLGAGLALPGVVSPDGELLRAPNLPRLTGARPGDLIGETLGSGTVLVDNEANLGALALLWSGASESSNAQDFVYVSGEVGVGAGIIVAGELFRGVNGFAGELGHVVVDRNGPPCGCGGQGCVEQYAGQDILLRTARATDIHALQEKIDLGDPSAVRAVEQAGSALGVGLASLLNLLDVPLVVLGGMYARLFDAIRPPLTAELGRRVLSVGGGGNDLLVRSPQGIDAAVRGAAGLVVHEAIKDPARLASADVA